MHIGRVRWQQCARKGERVRRELALAACSLCTQLFQTQLVLTLPFSSVWKITKVIDKGPLLGAKNLKDQFSMLAP